jgi:hypothetical protein
MYRFPPMVVPHRMPAASPWPPLPLPSLSPTIPPSSPIAVAAAAWAECGAAVPAVDTQTPGSTTQCRQRSMPARVSWNVAARARSSIGLQSVHGHEHTARRAWRRWSACGAEAFPGLQPVQGTGPTWREGSGSSGSESGACFGDDGHGSMTFCMISFIYFNVFV